MKVDDGPAAGKQGVERRTEIYDTYLLDAAHKRNAEMCSGRRMPEELRTAKHG